MTCNADLQPWHWAPQSGDLCPATMPDWILSLGDLGRADGQSSVIMTQLLTDLRSGDKRGWWGDEFQPFPIGSELWTLEGKPLNEAAIVDTERFIREALEPLSQQGIFETFTVRAYSVGKTMQADISISTDGETVFETTYRI